MYFRGLHLFAKQSGGGLLLAAWHSRHSLTWRWSVSINRDHSGRAWPMVMPHRNNNGLQMVFRIPLVCFIHISQQRPMWYRNLYMRMRDEQDQLNGMLWLNDKHPHKLHQPLPPRVVSEAPASLQ